MEGIGSVSRSSGFEAVQHADRVGLDMYVAGDQRSDDDCAEYEKTGSTIIALARAF